ncbi:MAG: FKBP-type peptidyl-prolyl cis-trans isomerase [Planctomycetota bacterium]
MTRKTLTGLLLAATTLTAGTIGIVQAQDGDKAAQQQADLEAAVAAALGEAGEKHDHDHQPTSIHGADGEHWLLDDPTAYPDKDGFASMFDRISYAIGRTDGQQIPASQPDLNTKTYGEGIKKGLAEENEDYALGYSQGFEMARRFLAQRDTEDMNMEAFIDGIAAALKEEDEGRSIGYLIGNSYRESEIGIKTESYLNGIDEAMLKPEPAPEGEEPKPVETKLTEEQVRETLNAFNAFMQEKQKQDAINEGKNYIEGLKADDGWKKTESGIAYRVVEAGDAEGKSPDDNDVCTMDYELRLLDGEGAGDVLQTTFDSPQTVPFSAKQVIKGWGEILVLMKPGDTFETVIPYDMGYGEQGSPPNIPPYATLIFKMKMHSFEAVPNEEEKKPLPGPAPAE